MRLEVKECPKAEFAHAISVENKAFRVDADTKKSVLFPGPFPANAAEVRLAEMLQEVQDDPSSIWLKVVDNEATNPSEGIAYARWHIYKDTAAGERPSRVWGEGANKEACDLFFGVLSSKMRENIGGKHCLFLNILVTDPEHWRRGAGGMLVKWGTDLADQYGLPAYLEATAKGLPVYKRFGFVEKEVLDVDLSRFGQEKPERCWLMWYDPKVKQ